VVLDSSRFTGVVQDYRGPGVLQGTGVVQYYMGPGVVQDTVLQESYRGTRVEEKYRVTGIHVYIICAGVQK